MPMNITKKNGEGPMFKKGNSEWKKGYPVTKAQRKRMSESATTRWVKWRIAQKKQEA